MATAITSPIKKQAVEKSDAPAWNTIHIFGYGESQVIGASANGKISNDKLKTIAPLFTYLTGILKKGSSKINDANLLSLNIFNGAFIDFHPRSANGKLRRISWSDLDAKQIEKFAKEIISKVPEQKSKNIFLKPKKIIFPDLTKITPRSSADIMLQAKLKKKINRVTKNKIK